MANQIYIHTTANQLKLTEKYSGVELESTYSLNHHGMLEAAQLVVDNPHHELLFSPTVGASVKEFFTRLRGGKGSNPFLP